MPNTETVIKTHEKNCNDAVVEAKKFMMALMDNIIEAAGFSLMNNYFWMQIRSRILKELRFCNLLTFKLNFSDFHGHKFDQKLRFV